PQDQRSATAGSHREISCRLGENRKRVETRRRYLERRQIARDTSTGMIAPDDLSSTRPTRQQPFRRAAVLNRRYCAPVSSRQIPSACCAGRSEIENSTDSLLARCE